MLRVGDVELGDILGVLDDPCCIIKLTMEVEAEDLHLSMLGGPILVVFNTDPCWHLGRLEIKQDSNEEVPGKTIHYICLTQVTQVTTVTQVTP